MAEYLSKFSDELIKEIKDEMSAEVLSLISEILRELNLSSARFEGLSELIEQVESLHKEIKEIKYLALYYEIPSSWLDVSTEWRLPEYLSEEVIVLDESREKAIQESMKAIARGDCVVILGDPGVGKTTILFKIFKQAAEIHDVAILRGTHNFEKRIHEKEGVLLFIDDITQEYEIVEKLAKMPEVKMIVASARTQEWDRLPLSVRNKFIEVKIEKFDEDKMKEITRKHLEANGISWDEEAIDIVAKKSQGCPIYVNFVISELRGRRKLTMEFAERMPEGMLRYIPSILERGIMRVKGGVLTFKEGGTSVALTLLTMRDMPNYEAHDFHVHKILEKWSRITGEGAKSLELFELVSSMILQYDPRMKSLKFSHDAIADILRGEVDTELARKIRVLDKRYSIGRRKGIALSALEEALEEVLESYKEDPIEYLRDALTIMYFTLKMEPAILGKFKEAITIPYEHLDDPISRAVIRLIEEHREKIEKAEREEITERREIGRAEGIVAQIKEYLKLGEPGLELAAKLAEGVIQMGTEDKEILMVANSALLKYGIKKRDEKMIRSAVERLKEIGTDEALINAAIGMIALGKPNEAIEMLRKVRDVRARIVEAIARVAIGDVERGMRILEDYTGADEKDIIALEKIRKAFLMKY